MNRLRLAVLALVLLAAAPAFAQTTIAGDWDMTINSPQGSNTVKVTVVWSVPEDGKMLEITMKGKLEGNVITGTAKLGDVGEGPLSARRTGDAGDR